MLDEPASSARAAALPDDYRVVDAEIKRYVSNLADGRRALEVTGDDVAGFCDELLRNARTYTQDWREKLNRTVHEKLGGRS